MAKNEDYKDEQHEAALPDATLVPDDENSKTKQYDIHSAIIAFHTHVKDKGLDLHHDDETETVEGFVYPKAISRLPSYVMRSVLLAVAHDKCSLESVGKFSNPGALVQGNVIALVNQTNGQYLRLCNGSVNYGGKPVMAKLAHGWEYERFLVVQAGPKTIALYSIRDRRFIGTDGTTWAASSSRIVGLHDRPRGNECFIVEKGGSANTIKLVCPLLASRWCSEEFVVVQVEGIM
mmetsp:Transcript_14808/g.41000  ORF Transcript_14808/g.41000 Transcript_14808/m.41000 type:complete len:234 (+) Transcript_14808:1194-1895(+)